MLQALRDATLWAKHGLYQVMVFEQSVTPPHKNSYYLNSYSFGCMTAAWVALEDIDPTATRFFIVPGSQDFDRDFSEEIWGPDRRYADTMSEILNKEYAGKVVIPEMKAGDLLFWNSRTIHGSLAGSDPNKSRLSVTAHYIPDGFGFGKRNKPDMVGHLSKLVEGQSISYFRPWSPSTSRRSAILRRLHLR